MRGLDQAHYYTFAGTETCEEVNDNNDYLPEIIKPSFSKDDSHIYVWLNLETLYEPVQARWEWYAPDGRLYDTHISPWTSDPQDFGYAYWYWWRMHSGWDLVNPAGGYWGTVGEEGRWETKVSVKPQGGSYEHVATLNWVMRYELTEHKMAEDVGGGENDPVNPKDVFSPSDARALTWARFVDVADPLDVKWIFYSPTGQYADFVYTSDDPGEDHWYAWVKTWGRIDIRGSAAAYQCGDWHVDVHVKDAWGNYEKKYSDTFRILETTPPTLSQVRASPTLPIETQPIVLSFSAADDNHIDRAVLHWSTDSGLELTRAWTNVNAGSLVVSHDIGLSRPPGTVVDFWAEVWDESGNRTQGEHGSVRVGHEAVSIPDVPEGPSYLKARSRGRYGTSGAATTLGGPVEYSFDWGDRVSPWGANSREYSWSNDGYYVVRVKARSQMRPERESGLSSGLLVTVDSVAPMMVIETSGGADFATDQMVVVLEGACIDNEPTSTIASISTNVGTPNTGTLFRWRFEVPLAEGPNPITVTAVDRAGNSGAAFINITLTDICHSAQECEDGVYCNGIELCDRGACIVGEARCIGANSLCFEELSGCCDLAGRFADLDGDDHVMLHDFSGVVFCLTGPCSVSKCSEPLYPHSCCQLGDANKDGAIDLYDVYKMQVAFEVP